MTDRIPPPGRGTPRTGTAVNDTRTEGETMICERCCLEINEMGRDRWGGFHPGKACDDERNTRLAEAHAADLEAEEAYERAVEEDYEQNWQ